MAWTAGWFALPLCAQPLQIPAPLASAPPVLSPAEIARTLAGAEGAHDFGQFSVAADLYRGLLSVEGVDQTSVKLALAGVLLDGDRAADAMGVLNTVAEPRGSAWHLRMGLAALQLRQRDLAQASWDAVNPAELVGAERAWHVFLEGALYDLLPVPNTQKANELYRAAEAAAVTELARARFQLAAERVRLHLAQPTDQQMEDTKRRVEIARASDLGPEQALNYAVMLVQRDRRADALAFLREQILMTRNQEARDQFNFLAGLIGDRGRGGEGRNALRQLLGTGANPERLRQALELLAIASPAGLDRAEFRSDLDKLIAATPAHPIKEALLYYRAQLALAEKEYETAERNADQLLRDFPASRLRIRAYGILTQSAWDQQRYRRAADNARRAREALLPESTPGSAAAQVRADLGIFEAEAWFRAGMLAERLELGPAAGKVDYQAAAGAYAALLRERPPEIDAKKLGGLMLQLVLAEINAGSGNAEKVLDELEKDPAFDLENRWQAEFSLARASRLQGNTAAAYARVTRLQMETLAGVEALPAALRARMTWLQADLSVSAGQPERTIEHADRLLRSLEGLDERLRQDVASMAIALKAEAELALNREEAALATFQRLRTEYPRSDAAVDSYLIQAEHYASQGKLDVAQRALTALVDHRDYASHSYIPHALYKLADLSARLGTPDSLRAATKRIEELIAHPAAADIGLIFRARMMQGDVFRKLNEYPLAQRAYEELVNKYPQRSEAMYAQLALAECHNAQSSADPRHAEIAKAKFEELLYRADAPLEVQTEAGYNLGLLLERAGKRDEAARVWWRDVVMPQLGEKPAPRGELGPTRAHWLGRTILGYADMQRKRDNTAEAIKALLLVWEKNLETAKGPAKDLLRQMGAPVPAS